MSRDLCSRCALVSSLIAATVPPCRTIRSTKNQKTEKLLSSGASGVGFCGCGARGKACLVSFSSGSDHAFSIVKSRSFAALRMTATSKATAKAKANGPAEAGRYRRKYSFGGRGCGWEFFGLRQDGGRATALQRFLYETLLRDERLWRCDRDECGWKNA
jgi:hypothetical protein